MRTPKQQARRDAMARTVRALRPYLQTPPCRDCLGHGYRRADFRLQRFVKCDCSRATRSGPTALALEIVKNAWTPYEGGEDSFRLALDLLAHRMRHGWLVCADPIAAAAAMSKTMPKRGPCNQCGRNSCDMGETLCAECQ